MMEQTAAEDKNQVLRFCLFVLILLLSCGLVQAQETDLLYPWPEHAEWPSMHYDEVHNLWFPNSLSGKGISLKDGSLPEASLIIEYSGSSESGFTLRLDWNVAGDCYSTIRFPLTGGFWAEVARLRKKYPSFRPQDWVPLIHYDEFSLGPREMNTLALELKQLTEVLGQNPSGNIWTHVPCFDYQFRKENLEYSICDCVASSDLNKSTVAFLDRFLPLLREKHPSVPKTEISLPDWTSDAEFYSEPLKANDKDWMFYYFENGSIEKAMELVRKHGWVHERNQYGTSPLLGPLLCCEDEEKVYDAVKTVLEMGADPNEKLNEGENALYMAANWFMKDVVGLLIQHGTDVNAAESVDSKTPLLKFLEDFNYCEDNCNEVLDLLLAAGADVNHQMKNGWSPLTLAVITGNEDLCKKLIDHGARPDLQTNEGQTALMLAIERGMNDTVQRLLKKGADPNLRDVDGWTALHYATRYGHTDIAEFLLKAGADPTAREQLDLSSAQIARINNHTDLAIWLVKTAHREGLIQE